MQPIPTITNMEKSVLRDLAYNELRTLKKGMQKSGFHYQHSFYYFIKVNGESKYRRIEVISVYPFTPKQIDYLHQLFSYKISGFDYALWIFNAETNTIHLHHYIDREDR